MAVMVEKRRCPENHPCPAVSVCPVGALEQKGYNAPTVNEERCTNCGKCGWFCPMGALKVTKSVL